MSDFPIRILITGASGFVGQYVVAEALRRGYKVQAMVRPHVNVEQLPWNNHPNLQLVICDLQYPQGLTGALHNADVVIHLAAVKSGSFDKQYAGTVTTTENLLDAMVQTQVLRLIAVSSMSVYDYQSLHSGDVLDECSELENNPKYRDGYTQTKLIQEQLTRTFEREHNGSLTIIRPGMIFGRGCLWHALLGSPLGKNYWLKIGGNAVMPMTYIENCAAAIVAAVDSSAAVGRIINIVDDELPTQEAYITELLKNTELTPKLISISWPNMILISKTAWWLRQFVLRGKVRLPGILNPTQLSARFKPLRYDNSLAKDILQWRPGFDFSQSLTRSCSSEKLL